MIRLLIVGAARAIFNLACLALLLALLLMYAAYRLLRSSVAKGRGQPVREAGFGVLVAVVVLARALAETQKAGRTMAKPDDFPPFT